MSIQLSDTRQTIERSLFEALRLVTVALGYIPDINLLSQQNIFGINTGTKKITISGIDLTLYYLPGRTFTIIGSLNNNGTYTVLSSSFQSSNTVITVVESIPNSTADGKASIYVYYDDSNGIALYNSAIAAIILTKGFAIDIFGVGQPRAKYQKKIPRIVIIPNQSLPGALGGNGDPIYIPIGVDPLAPTSFTKQVLPPQTVDFTYDLHLVSSTAEQARVLHGISAYAWPKRGYVNLITDPTQKFFIESFSYRNIPNPMDNIMEDVYMYKASDMYETNNTEIGTGIIPITEIDVDIEVGDTDTPRTVTKFGSDFVID